MVAPAAGAGTTTDDAAIVDSLALLIIDEAWFPFFPIPRVEDRLSTQSDARKKGQPFGYAPRPVRDAINAAFYTHQQ